MAKSTIRNLDRLQRELKRLPDAVKADIQRAIGESADEIVALAKSLAPVDDGDLRDSIGWTWGEAPKGSLTLAAIGGPPGLRATIYAGNNKAYYARWVEFGTAPHIAGGKFAGATHPGTTAQPFFFVSYRALRKPAKARIRKAIRTAAHRVAAGG